MGARDFPPPEACCGACFWGRRMDYLTVFLEDGKEVARHDRQLRCNFQRPPVEVREDWLCPDWAPKMVDEHT